MKIYKQLNFRKLLCLDNQLNELHTPVRVGNQGSIFYLIAEVFLHKLNSSETSCSQGAMWGVTEIKWSIFFVFI